MEVIKNVNKYTQNDEECVVSAANTPHHIIIVIIIITEYVMIKISHHNYSLFFNSSMR